VVSVASDFVYAKVDSDDIEGVIMTQSNRMKFRLIFRVIILRYKSLLTRKVSSSKGSRVFWRISST